MAAMRSLSFALALAVLWSVEASAQNSWESVTSKEGQFAVEMPVKPTLNRTRTRKGPEGTSKIIIIAARTDSGVYMVQKIEFPTPIVKGAEEAALNSERDEWAQEWNGKVIGEKKVRAGLRSGRDFTIRGKPAEETGVLTIRVREYLDGKAIYAVMVVSAPNRELPEDTGRFLGSLAIGETKARASGKPEPEPTGKELAGWGLAIDPGKDCEFKPDGKTIAIQVPGKLHDLNPESGILNAPRVVKEIDGDFNITVKVAGEFKPGGKSTNPRGVPYNGGGIIIWSDSDNFIRLERGAMLRMGAVRTFVTFEEREGGYRGAVHNEIFPDGPCYVRLERKGSRIFGGISRDGKSWKVLKPIDTLWPAKLKVGLSAINSNSEPLTVKFEEFSLHTRH
jgi:regulation of enolase protein 1 (concanavalin A-like superfamily)